MPSSYLNDLRIELQADGENASTWGQKLNDALTQIGDALAYGTQDCFATDANATTTVADGAADPARAMYFKVTSTATLTATRTLTIAPNTISRVMFIENATTGSQSITISQGSGSTVTIATGKTAVVYLDGAGATAAVVDAMAKVDPGVTDTLAEVLVAGNTSGGTGLTMSSGDDLTLTGAAYNVVWDSSDNALEFADNAKAVFGAGSDLTIFSDGGTFSYINNTQGVLRIRNTSDDQDVAIQSDNGSGGVTDYFLADGSTGSAKLYNYGAEKLATTSTGIDVTGSVTADGLTVAKGSNGTYATLSGDDAGGGRGLSFTSSSVSGSVGAKHTLNALSALGEIALQTNSKNRLNIGSGGDISFYEDTGTTAKLFWDASAESLMLNATTRIASEILTVNGTVTTGGGTVSAPALAFRADSNTGMYRPASQSIGFSTNGSEAMRIDSAGKLTYGGISYGVAVDPDGFGGFGAGYNFETNGGSPRHLVTGPVSGQYLSSGSSPFIAWYTATSSAAGTAAAERMRIDSSGKVGIGVTSPSSYYANELVVNAGGEGGLTLVGDITHENYLAFADGTTGADRYSGYLSYNHGSNFMRFATNGGIERMRIDSSGNVVIGATSVSNPNSYGAVLNVEGYAPALVLSEDTGRDYTIGVNGNNLNIFNETTNVLTIADSGKVGIGTTPVRVLDIATTTGGTIIHLTDDATGHTATDGVDIQQEGTLFQILNREAGDIRFGTNNTERMRIDSSGRVGIGTSSPSSYSSASELVVDTGVSGGITVVSDSTAGGYGSLFFADGTTGNEQYRGYVQYNHNNGGSVDELLFGTAGSEAMRIDSNGNLLVGKTSTGIATVGTQIEDTGGVYSTVASERAFIGNRTTTDGSIIELRKDNATVGSIGADYTGTSAAGLFIGNGTNGLFFNGSADIIQPYSITGGENVDNTIDLGNSAKRFKDLYLSGGVVFGATGGAVTSKTLDDYEEGTWTPVLKRDGSTNNATITLSGSALYTKVGRMVTVSFYLNAIDYSAVTDGSNAIITGLPFSASSSTWFSGNIGYGTSTNASNTTWVVSGSNGYFLNSTNSAFRNGTIDLNRGMFTLTYQTA